MAYHQKAKKKRGFWCRIFGESKLLFTVNDIQNSPDGGQDDPRTSRICRRFTSLLGSHYRLN